MAIGAESGTLSLIDGAATASAVRAETLTPGDLVDGLYRVERLLGEGGGGAVYLVRHERLGEARFALKVLHTGPDDSVDALTREGRLAALVRSPHVVKVASLGRLLGGAPYLVMEYVDGTTLDALLDQRELTVAESIECGRQLCLALEAAHGQGLIHGDVSLRNLFITVGPDDRLHLQLGDFGLVQRVRGDASATISVDLGNARGTPRFMAPERIAGVDVVDQRSDLFSAGVVLYRLLSGSYPFDGGAAHEILGAILRGAPQPLAERRPAIHAVAAVVMRCLASAPASRFASARELRLALDDACNAEPVTPATPAPSVRRRGRVAMLSMGGVVVAAAAAAWSMASRTPRATLLAPPTALACPDTTGVTDQPDVAHALAQALCARLANQLDIDWGGGPDATVVASVLGGDAARGFELVARVDGRHETGRGATPLLAAIDAAHRMSTRFAHPAMTADELRRWGARDADSALAARTVWLRRITLLLDDYEQAPRAVLARDPTSPLMHLLLAEVDQDPARLRQAKAEALANADRLSPDRAAMVRGFIAVREHPDTPAPGLAQLRRAHSSSPDDLVIAVLYVSALVSAGRAEAALAVIDDLHVRFPRRALLAFHHGGNLAQRIPGERAYLDDWIMAVLPEARAWTGNVNNLTGLGRLDEARAALDFGRRLGLPEERTLLARAVLELAAGNPAAVPLRQLGDTRAWTRSVGARIRVAVFLLSGQISAAITFMGSEIAESRAAGDEARAVVWTGELLKVIRRSGGASLPSAQLDQMERGLASATLALTSHAAATTELILARSRAGAPLASVRAALAALDQTLVERAGTDAIQLLDARLRTLPLVRVAAGDAAAAERWRMAAQASFEERVMTALDAALALDAIGDEAGAEAAYRLAASTYAIERHCLDSVAARLRLVDRFTAAGRAAESASDLAFVDRVFADADPGLRDRLRGRP